MKIADLLKMMFLITFLAVLYIHVQMSIYDLAYQAKTRQQKIDKLEEVNAIAHNDITRLKSSDHIGRELLVKGKSYQFVGRDKVVEVAEERSSLPEILASGAQATGGFFSRVMTTLAFSPVEPGMAR